MSYSEMEKSHARSKVPSRDVSINNPAYEGENNGAHHGIEVSMSANPSQRDEYTELDNSVSNNRRYESLKREDHTYQEVPDLRETPKEKCSLWWLILLFSVILVAIVVAVVVVFFSVFGENTAGEINWSRWAECTVSCGNGLQLRRRDCNGTTCGEDDSQEMRTCSRQCPFWNEWDKWGGCNAVCGLGTQQRQRICVDNDLTGGECTGKGTDTRDCSFRPGRRDHGWSSWMNWGDCDVTCDGGIQTRSRYCTDIKSNLVDNSYCVGISVESQLCSNWSCPDCGQVCEHGVLNSNCDACECTFNTLYGYVYDVNDRPISNVKLSYQHRPYVVLETTDKAGEAVIPNVCATPTYIVASKEQYRPVVSKTEVINEATSSVSIVMERIESPLILNNPRSKVRVTGESVTFCCNALDANDAMYEWFKNGDILSTANATSKLMLSNLTSDDCGSYNCRVSNIAGSVISSEAVLRVTEMRFGCDPSPKTNLVQLSPDCIQSDGTTTYDVGRCSYVQCGGLKGEDQTLCVDAEEFCCTVNETKLVPVTCSNYEILLQEVVSCSCNVCQELPARISGRLLSAEDGSPVLLASVYFNQEKITNTNLLGFFQWEVNVDTSRVSLHFSDDLFGKFVSTTKVINVADGSNVFFTVKMKSKPLPFQIVSSIQNAIAIAGGYLDPIAEIILPPNSFYDEMGDLYTGPVNVSLTNFDMRKEGDVEIAPGDFTSRDQAGNVIKVLSFGIFMFDFINLQGQGLFLGGEVPINVDLEIVPTPVDTGFDGDSRIHLGILNKRTGSWEKVGDLVRTSSKRRRKQIEKLVANFEIIPNESYSIYTDNFDEEVCFAKFIPYSTEMFFPSEVLSNVQFVSLLDDTSVSNHFLQYSETWSNSGSWWNAGPGACVPVACTSSHSCSVKSFVSAHIDQTFLIPALQETQTSIPSQLGILSNLDYMPDLRNSSKSVRLTILKTSITYQDPPGPLYARDEEQVCQTAGFDSYHFQFHSVQTAPISPVLKLNTQAEQTCHLGPGTLETPYSFYPRNNDYECPSHPCFIRISIFSSLEINRVVAKSFASDETIFPEISAPMYGLRSVYAVKNEANSIDFEACVEFKCPGLVYDKRTLLGTDFMTSITLDVWDKDDNLQLCNVCANSEHFLRRVSYANETSANTIPLCVTNVTGAQTPVSFNLPYFIDAEAGVYGNNIDLSAYDSDFHNLNHCASIHKDSALSFTCP